MNSDTLNHDQNIVRPIASQLARDLTPEEMEAVSGAFPAGTGPGLGDEQLKR